ncbi:hypothetical protein B0T19DRAFT_426060 [Cercophora scortea]|uniref:Pentatricopeptide repeat-containing protein-mitochondrial domain-containing protein n=1 Tax=Cercophora scortea TaxID=314031 RepID=A0AAE0IEA9_9PEZI|nr:hypothetical protein B0T19DRAFT_426060 [Cercophora scortea]
MPPLPSRITVDGLWRCLCPSIDATFLAKAVVAATPAAPRPSRIGSSPLRPRPHPRPRPRSPCLARSLHTDSPGTPVTAFDLVQGGGLPQLKLASTPVIYETLRELRNHQGQGKKIRQFVQYLIKDRHEKPNIFLYEALITANWDVLGSADELERILNALGQDGIEPSPSLYHSALRLLAVHPDYLLRNRILRDMRAGRTALKPDGKCSVALGLLRDGQWEMAVDYLDDMLRDKVDVPAWVLDIYMFTLGSLGFVDEALHLLQQRLDAADNRATAVSHSVWYFLLDECSRALHHAGTKRIWDDMVEPGTLNPSDGMVLNVLNTASRANDPKLATQAIQHLSARRVKLGAHHYEALIDSYANGGDLENALQVLCIMASSAGTGFVSDAASTRSIYALLKRNPARISEASGLLLELRKRVEIPISAVNVLIEAACSHTDDETMLATALEIYNHAHHLSPAGPNMHTFQLLLPAAQTSATAEFLVSEMALARIKVTPLMLNHIVRCHALDGDLDAAFRYMAMQRQHAGGEKATNNVCSVEEAVQFSRLNRRTLFVLMGRCFKDEDPRAWTLVDEARRRKFAGTEGRVKQLLAGREPPVVAGAEEKKGDDVAAAVLHV